MREMPPRASFTRSIFVGDGLRVADEERAGGAALGVILARVVGGQPRSLPISVKVWA